MLAWIVIEFSCYTIFPILHCWVIWHISLWFSCNFSICSFFYYTCLLGLRFFFWPRTRSTSDNSNRTAAVLWNWNFRWLIVQAMENFRRWKISLAIVVKFIQSTAARMRSPSSLPSCRTPPCARTSAACLLRAGLGRLMPPSCPGQQSHRARSTGRRWTKVAFTSDQDLHIHT